MSPLKRRPPSPLGQTWPPKIANTLTRPFQHEYIFCLLFVVSLSLLVISPSHFLNVAFEFNAFGLCFWRLLLFGYFTDPCSGWDSGWEERKTNERQMACVTSSSVLSEPPIVFSHCRMTWLSSFRVPFSFSCHVISLHMDRDESIETCLTG